VFDLNSLNSGSGDTSIYKRENMMKTLSGRESRILQLIDNAKLGIVVIDQSHHVVEANQRFADMLGYTHDEVKTLSTWDWEVSTRKEAIESDYGDLSNIDFSIETRHRRKDGSIIDVEVSGTGYNFGGTPENNTILCFCNDISDRKIARQALIESERRFKSYVENAADIIFTIDSKSEIQYISPNCEKILGYSPDELSGGRLYECFESDDKNSFLTDIHLYMDNHPRPVCEYRLQHKNGGLEWYSFRFSRTIDFSTEEPLLICLAGNIDGRKENEAKLEYISMHDQLTGIYNRSFFYEELARIDQQNIYPISILTFDLDDFKHINDTYGHAVGDDVLARCARVVGDALRKSDVFARNGGDEFSILLPMTSYAEVLMLAQRMIERINKDNACSLGPTISISVGAATKTDQTEHINSILQLADQRMYKEKREKFSTKRNT
jgi:diguanylate cyclase (GGDEF)-like protein/PAS domain S-box-containing protein